MPLEDELAKARKEIVSDGYEMSFGEVMNLYQERELIIDPAFQRLFRWDISRKTRFIESLLLGIPIPPIFVFQNEDGIWELVDGLQRLSTVFEFASMLRLPDGRKADAFLLEGTEYLPSLADKRWESSGPDADDGIGKTLQLQIKRARIRVEILKKESHSQAKYELFQRLNTGGANLSEQEVRNCIAIMLNRPFHDWTVRLSEDPHFLTTTRQTEDAQKRQMMIELVIRFLAFRHIPYQRSLDVHQYLDKALVALASEGKVDLEQEEQTFQKTFSLLDKALGEDVFKKWDGTRFSGKFLLSVFEVVAIGVSKRINEIEKLPEGEQVSFVTEKAKSLWGDPIFQKNSGAGIRGTTRLSNLLPLANDFFHL